MKKNFLLQLIIALMLSVVNLSAFAKNDFYAYYTKIQYSAKDYMSDYADIIVVMGKGKQLEFTRRTLYQPLWRTRKGAFLVDDLFPEKDKDYQFDYSYVRLIENTPEKIVVHWRYMPDIKVIEKGNAETDPLTINGFTDVVHEIYTIYPDGRVERVVKDARNTLASDWADPNRKIRQTIWLREDGIEQGRVNWGRKREENVWDEDEKNEKVNKFGNPIIDLAGLPEPIHYWTFDDGINSSPKYVLENIDDEDSRVEGLYVSFKKGISGTALVFDGYYTGIEMPSKKDNMKDEMSIDLWAALDVYPYNDAPLIHQSQGFGKQGYYLGVDPYGYPFFRLNGTEIKSKEKIPLYKWQHFSVTAGKGKIKLYQNDKVTASCKFNGKLNLIDTVTKIGLNTEKARCSDYVRDFPQNIPFIFGIQGVIDEVRIFNKTLSGNEINNLYTTYFPKNDTTPIAKGVLPGENSAAQKFGAYYKTLKFQEVWDNMWRLSDYADVVVKFDNMPTSVIYWHGTNYAANWITDQNRWMSDQSSETWGPHGCSEHMADKQVRHCRVSIIENTPARIVLHWRYPCVDVGYVCNDKRNWTDEIQTIYPDGIGVRKVLWEKGYNQPGFEDIQFLTNPGETPLDVVNLQASTVANTNGDVEKLLWKKPNKIPKISIKDATIELLNSKSKYKIFVVFQGGTIHPWGENEQSKYTDDPFAGPWNHWPMHFVPSDGRFAVDKDRVTHFALGANDSSPQAGSMVMYGFTEQGILNVIPIAKSWKNPPEVNDVKGIKSMGYDKAQRAFVFDGSKETASFSIQASEKRPVINPCFVLKHWNGVEMCAVKLNGSKVKPENIRYGIHRDTDGSRTLVIWMKTIYEKTLNVEINRL